MTQNTLFEMEESPSPRLKWLKKHNISTFNNPDTMEDEEGPWEAFIGDYEKAVYDAGNSGKCYPWDSPVIAYGFASEEDAIVELAKRNGWHLWNEEEL